MVCGHRHQVGRRKRSGRSEGYAGMGDASLGAKSKLKGSVRCQTAAKGPPMCFLPGRYEDLQSPPPRTSQDPVADDNQKRGSAATTEGAT